MTRLEDRDRRAVSIEQLLQWAYAAQMVHQAQRGPVGTSRANAPVAASSSLWREASPVQSSGRQGFEAAPDAWRVHDLVMTLGMVTVDCGQDLAAARYHALGQYRGAEPPTGAVGTADRSARPWPTNGLLQIDLRMLVMIHASKETRPPTPTMRPSLRFKPGQTVWHPTRKTKVYAKGWFSHVQAEGDLPGDLRKDGEVYGAWRAALAGLRDQATAIRLTMFSVTSDLPPAARMPAFPLAG